MIIVLADDLTGAAEIAGIGYQYGINAEVQTEFFPDTAAELVVIDTDSRSCPPLEAARRVKDVTQWIKEIGADIDFIYKKTDSVLRGPIIAELNAMLNVLDAQRVLLVPANPSKDRIIRQGKYFIKGQPLSETGFAHDTEYPATSSDVLELLGLPQSSDAGLLKCGQVFTTEKIAVGEAETDDDLLLWAERLDEQTIPAGAGDFFAAILRSRGLCVNTSVDKRLLQMQCPALFVLGSGSDYSRETLRRARRFDRPVYPMPEKLFTADSSPDKMSRQWAGEIIKALKVNDCVIAAIDKPPVSDAELARRLTHDMAAMVQQVLSAVAVRELYIEGGATASEIVRQLGWKRFCPCDNLASGVVRMRVAEKENHYLTIKPGSYAWPEVIWNLMTKGVSRANTPLG